MKPKVLKFATENREKSKRYFLLLLPFILLLPIRSVLAHGGGVLQVANVPIGTYQVSVWTNPPTARTNQPVHVTVGIAAAETGEPVLDTAVKVDLLTNDGVLLTTAVATTEQSVNRLFYEADLAGVAAGDYEIQVEVVGSEGSGSLSFSLSVKPVSIWPWALWILLGVGVIGVGLILWRKKRGSTWEETAVSRHRSVD
ncbi:MAG: hypothetical protein GY805_31395 [Chloroflexi bacterium]|nr:hypothetical protein [Chloroflexota bacterium]